MSTTLIISPHLDDAVFSCEGLIRDRVKAGQEVIVATVFSQGAADHAIRCDEDLSAAQVLGFEAVHLGFTDAPFRPQAHRGYRELLFGWNAGDDTCVVEVAKALERLRREVDGGDLFTPLAVGGHVDHRIVFEAVRQSGWTREMHWYEDRPYAYARGAAALRLRQLGTMNAGFDAELLLHDWRALPFVKLYAPAGEAASDCERGMLAAPDALPMSAEGWLLPCDHAMAARHYASQYDAFCGGAEAHRQLDLRHSQHLGSDTPRCERYWQLYPHEP